MKLLDIKVIAQDKGVKPGSMKKTELIRAIQRTEGNRECFGAKDVCEYSDCLWRGDCKV